MDGVGAFRLMFLLEEATISWKGLEIWERVLLQIAVAKLMRPHYTPTFGKFQRSILCDMKIIT
jgi:hypothetical protein